MTLVAEHGPRLRSLAAPEHLAVLDRNLDNIRAALEWASANDHLLLARLAVGLHSYWSSRCSFREALVWVNLALSDPAMDLRLRQPLLGSAGFHFMGHGIRDGAGSDLMLNDNLSLNARYFSPEILKRSRLAVLSACSTGVGKENGLLDTENLVHSFLSAGVPSVIASHWNVDSASTGRLMSSFYVNLAKGESVVHAIHDARNEMLTTQSHPYFWAGFNLAGRAN